MKYKYLLNFWWAKDLPEVIDENKKLNIDQLVFKYWKYPKPHKMLDIILKDGILDEYDYIIFTSPDLVVKQENIDQIINDIETTDAPVMGAVCNVDMSTQKNKLGAVKGVKGRFTKYDWVEKGTAHGIQQVVFNGFVLLTVSTKLLKEYKFFEQNGDPPIDAKMCAWFVEKKIPIMTNFDNYMLHLRYQGRMLAGKRTPEVIFKGRNLVISEEEPYLLSPVKYVM